MKTMPIDQLEPGMTLAADALGLNGGVLLKQGTVLNDNLIKSLERRGVQEVRIDVPEQETPELSEEEQVHILEAARDHLRRFFMFVDHGSEVMQELHRLAVLRTAMAIRQGFVPPRMTERPDVLAQDMNDLFFREEGTPEDVVLHEVQLSSFPDVYFKILSILRSPTSSAKQIADVVGQDSSLSAKLLKLVNSPFYGFPSQIDSLPRAVALVGGNELSTLALGISAISVFKDIPPQLVNMRQFWTHSLRCAIFCKLLAGFSEKNLQERHFVSGLLHDIGKLLIYKKLPHVASQALVYSLENGVPEYVAENEAIGFDHTRIGMLLVKEWNFPKCLWQGISLHHAPRAVEEDLGPSIVHMADIMSIIAAMPHEGVHMIPALDQASSARLKLQPQMLADLFQSHDLLMEQLAGVFLD